MERIDYIIAGFGGVNFEDGATAPGEFMFAPAGLHKITGDRNGSPTQLHIKIDADTASAMNNVLRAYRARDQKPYFDFNHSEAEASAWPEEFVWKDGAKPGVYVKCSWSKPGNDAVVGKTWRTFSPAFAPDKWVTSEKDPARMIAAPLVMGGLVNDPAFKKMSPLWARNQSQDSMEKTPEQKITELQEELATLKAAAKTAPDAAVLRAKNEEAAQLKIELDAANATLKARNEERADTLIATAQARGALPTNPAKDSAEDKLLCRYRDLLIADPANAVIVANLPGNAAVGGGFLTAGRGGRLEITAPSIENALRGYMQARQADEDVYPTITANNRRTQSLGAPRLYAKDLRGLLEKPESAMEVMRTVNRLGNLDDVPLTGMTAGGFMRAANALGTLSGILVVQRSLDLLKYSFPELSRVTTDFSAEPVQYNQQVTTRLRAIPGSTAYDPAAGYGDNDVTDTDVSITINTHKAVQIVYTANDLASTKRLLFPEQEEGMHQRVGLDLIGALLANITPANFTGQAGDGTNGPTGVTVGGSTKAAVDQMNRNIVIALKTALNQRGAQGGTRTLLLNELYHAQLEADTTVVGNLINRNSGDTIMTGRLPIIAGFQPIEAPYLPATNNLVGFAMRSDALALAVRLPNDYSTVFPGVTGGGVVQIVTNPDTGVSVMLVMFLDHKLGQTRMRVAYMFGTAIGQQKSGQLLVSK